MKKTLFLILLLSLNVFSETTLFELKEPGGKTHFIFGTLHSDDNRVTNFDSRLIDIIKKSDVFLMETDELSNASVLLNNDLNITEHLNEDEQDKLKKYIEFHVMFFDQVIKMKPWLLAFVFDSPRPATPFNQDNLLKRIAEDSGVKTQGLMTNEDHFEVLDFLTLEEQMTILKNSLNRNMVDKENNFDELIEAYLGGDLKNINRVNERITSSLMSEKVWKKIKQKILIDRNKLFVKKIEQQMIENNIFLAVGASHLSENDGIIDYFVANGYEVNRINFQD